MSCSISETDRLINREATDSALCERLKVPINELADELILEQEKTPTGVILKGSKVIRGYDGGCS